MFHVPEQYRVRSGPMASYASDGNCGSFILSSTGSSRVLSCIVSDGLGWEHVSVKAHKNNNTGTPRIPTWTEMCRIKETFWDLEDVVMQLHPRASEYVNNHPSVLHLWRPTSGEIPEPPRLLVGIPRLEMKETL